MKSANKGFPMTLPLAGKTVLLTRPRRQAEETRPLLENLGASVLIQPVQEILPAGSVPAELFTPASLASFDWVIFSSSNGVDHLLRTLERLDRGGNERRTLLGRIRLAAVGPGTARRLEEAGFRPDLVPGLHSAEGLLRELSGEARHGARFLSIRGSGGRQTLREGLTALGGDVQEVSLYRTREIKTPDEKIVRLMKKGAVHYTFVTSPATAMGTVRLFGENLRNTELVSISPLTSAALAGAGYTPAREAADASIAGMIGCLTRD